MYQIDFSESSRTLHLKLAGHWDGPTMRRFSDELIAKLTQIRRRWDYFGLLSDSSQFVVQTAEIAEAFKTVMTESGRLHRGPTAIVVASVLNKLQVERTFTGDKVKVFLDAAEADRWLAERMAAPAAD